MCTISPLGLHGYTESLLVLLVPWTPLSPSHVSPISHTPFTEYIPKVVFFSRSFHVFTGQNTHYLLFAVTDGSLL